MYRYIALVLALLAFVAVPALAQDKVATTSGMIQSATAPTGRVLGLHKQGLDMLGINLAVADHVKVRDVYEIRRRAKKVGEAVVVFVGSNYSLLVTKGASNNIQAGDEVVYARHADIETPREMPKGDTVHVTERDVISSRQCTLASHFFLPGFAMPSFSSPSFSLPTWQGPAFTSPSFSMPTFAAPSFSSTGGFSAGGFQMPGFSLPAFSSPSF